MALPGGGTIAGAAGLGATGALIGAGIGSSVENIGQHLSNLIDSLPPGEIPYNPAPFPNNPSEETDLRENPPFPGTDQGLSDLTRSQPFPNTLANQRQEVDVFPGDPCLTGLVPPFFEASDSTDPIKLTAGGRKKIGNLDSFKDKTAAEAIRERGGGQSQVRQLDSGYDQIKVGEIANRAAQGDKAAETALKIIKQASKKNQKYGGK